MGRLTAAAVRNITKPGRHADGEGLYLNVRGSGSKSWLQRVNVGGRRRELGLGPYPRVSLAEARRAAASNRADAAGQRDPFTGRRRPAPPTFAEAAASVHAMNRARWSSDHHANFWLRSLELHAAAIWDMKLDEICPTDVIECLAPMWTVKPETMRRVRQRVQTVFRWGMAYGYIGTNPAGEMISAALPTQPRVKAHLASVHYLDLPDTLATVRSSGAADASKTCIEFIVLTAARSGEARLATWAEIDQESATWTVPASRMKRRITHRVPLSAMALSVLEDAKAIHDGSGLIFPSPRRPGMTMPADTLVKVLRDNGINATVHGFRSSFKTWAIERSDANWAVTEAALSHQVGDATESAYVRGDLFAKRRALMDQWAQYVGGNTPVP